MANCYLERCYFCDNEWGSCRCRFPDSTEEEVPGFEFGGCWITSPNVSCDGMCFVDPILYYGAVYVQALEAGSFPTIFEVRSSS